MGRRGGEGPANSFQHVCERGAAVRGDGTGGGGEEEELDMGRREEWKGEEGRVDQV